MPTKKPIITAVRCVISLGLGYWYGLPKAGAALGEPFAAGQQKILLPCRLAGLKGGGNVMGLTGRLLVRARGSCGRPNSPLVGAGLTCFGIFVNFVMDAIQHKLHVFAQ